MFIRCGDGSLLNLGRFDRLKVAWVEDAGWAVVALRQTVRGDGSVHLESRTISTHYTEEEARAALEALAERLTRAGWMLQEARAQRPVEDWEEGGG